MTPKNAAQEIFLECLGRGYSATTAALKAGVSRTSVYNWRNDDPEFAAAWREAEEAGTDLMEDEAKRRAFEGLAKPVYQGGQLVGHVPEFSDTLAIFLLKARRPEKYRERLDVNSKSETKIIEVQSFDDGSDTA